MRPLVLASLGAIVINGTSAWLLASVRHRGGSLSRAAFLSARNDVLVNVAIIVMGVVTIWTDSGWPDLVLGCFIILLALHAAYEVWEVSEEERLAAKALAGDEIDQCRAGPWDRPLFGMCVNICAAGTRMTHHSQTSARNWTTVGSSRYSDRFGIVV